MKWRMIRMRLLVGVIGAATFSAEAAQSPDSPPRDPGLGIATIPIWSGRALISTTP